MRLYTSDGKGGIRVGEKVRRERERRRWEDRRKRCRDVLEMTWAGAMSFPVNLQNFSAKERRGGENRSWRGRLETLTGPTER